VKVSLVVVIVHEIVAAGQLRQEAQVFGAEHYSVVSM
jgi:hypothetical protein